MDRRSFLTGISTLALSQILGGCGGGNKETLKVHFLKNSLPAQLVRRCRQELGQSFKLDVTPESQIADLFAQLQALSIPPTPSKGLRPAFGQSPWLPNLLRRDQPGSTQQNLFSLGNYWLATAIQQNLIQPLQPTQLAHWNQLPPRWQELVTRDRQGNLASQGQVWGAPYRWGTTMIAYRQDQFERLGWTPTDWSDLWRPALSRRVSLPDQSREVIGLTLKKLGESYNENIQAVPRLEPELRSLHQQVKLYSSDAYLQPLILGDTWVAVGWSTDILPLVRRDRQIRAVIPRSGTALWADLWVHPAAGTPESINPWIDFWWQPEIATQLSQLSNGGSPLLAGSSLDQALSLPDQQVFARSEFIGPLPDPAVEQYRSLWLKIRRAA